MLDIYTVRPEYLRDFGMTKGRFARIVFRGSKSRSLLLSLSSSPIFHSDISFLQHLEHTNQHVANIIIMDKDIHPKIQ